jgi:ribosomal protein L37AE/L43A
MRDFDLHQWFSRDELAPCPACHQTAGIRVPESGSFLCLECGHVQDAGAAVEKAQAQVPPEEPT